MTYARHLFISYAHLDDEPIASGEAGWVSRFHAALEKILSTRLGRRIEVWRDPELAGHDVFASEIADQLSNTAVLVSVLTPRYVESDWCVREAHAFCAAASRSAGLLIGNKARVFKIVKTPVDSEDPLPPVMKDLLGYEFYTLDNDRTPLELDPAYGPEMGQQFNRKLAKLAWDLAQLLKTLGAPGTAAPAGPAKPVVYLAETSYDRRAAREALESDLRLHGYEILPDRPTPGDEPDYVESVNRWLDRSQLAIHMIGSSYGGVPDGPSRKSETMWQNELAAARSGEAGLQRIIWLPEGTQSEDPAQQRWIEAVRNDPAAQAGADLITGDLEALKGVVHAALAKLVEPPKPPPPPGAALLFLLCDERDRKATIPLRKALKAAGVDVQIPLFEGDSATIRRTNEESLAQSSAVLLFWGAGDEAWKRAVDGDLRKTPGKLVFTYLSEPATAGKTDLVELEEPNLLDGLGGYSDALLEPLLTALRSSHP